MKTRHSAACPSRPIAVAAVSDRRTLMCADAPKKMTEPNEPYVRSGFSWRNLASVSRLFVQTFVIR
jgi:hypothetical protein